MQVTIEKAMHDFYFNAEDEHGSDYLSAIKKEFGKFYDFLSQNNPKHEQMSVDEINQKYIDDYYRYISKSYNNSFERILRNLKIVIGFLNIVNIFNGLKKENYYQLTGQISDYIED